MKNYLVKVLLSLFLLAVAPALPGATANAAPGDFLFQIGTPHLFDNPRGVAFDSSGNMYVLDNGSISVIDKAGKLVRRFGSYGSGDGQFEYGGGIAIAGSLVYVTDIWNARVLVFDTSGNFIKSWGSQGDGNGQFYEAGSIATDSKGNVYVVDIIGTRIQVFQGDGTFIRAFGEYGNLNAQFYNPSDVAVDSAGNIIVVDDNKIQVFDNEGRFLRSLGPYGYYDSRIAVDGAGNVYVTTFPNYEIPVVKVFDSGGNFLRQWGGYGSNEGEFSEISDLAIDASGKVYVADSVNGRVEVFDSSGKFLSQVGGGPGQFSDLADVATDRSGNVYVSDRGHKRIQIFDRGGTFVKMLNRLGEYLGPPNTLAIDGAGNIYTHIEGISMRLIDVFDNNGNNVKQWAVSEYDAYPNLGDLAVDSDGDLYLADYGAHQILEYAPSGALTRSWGGLGSGAGEFSSPTGVALDSSGNVYVADSGNHRVQVFTGDGGFLRSWGSQGSGNGQFYSPTWIALDGANNVYVTDYDAVGGNSRIQVFDTQGRFLGKWGSSGSAPGQFIHPAGLATSPSGDIVYVVDYGNDRIQAYRGYGGQVSPGWTARDIGSVGLAGRSSLNNGIFTVQGSGADIWGSADAFQFFYKPLTGDGEIVARVASVQNTNGYAKGGVMIRDTLAANAAHAMVDVTPGHGAEFSRRVSTGGSTSATVASGVAAPEWVKLVRKGSSFSGYLSKDGVSWTSLGSATISMGSAVYVGLIASSHNNSALCTATMDKVSLSGQASTPSVNITAPSDRATFTAPATIPITAAATPAAGAAVAKVEIYADTTLVGTATAAPYSVTWSNVPAGSYSLTAKVTDSSGGSATSSPVAVTVTAGGLPAPWATRDVGSVGVAGSASYANSAFTLKGSGADIWGSSDAFRFVYKTLNGDGEIVARVASLQNTNSYAKSGVMIRQSLAANSMHAMMDLKPSGGAEFSRRTSTGGTTTVTARYGIGAPYWVKLTRSGSTFRGYVSADGKTWSQVGSATISMTGTVYVGLVVNSHNNSTLCTTTIDGVK